MLYHILKRSSERLPDKTAIACNDRVYSYRELLDSVDKAADSLSKLGLGSGDRIALFLYNSPEIVICYFASFKIGATLVPVNYRLKEDEVHYIIDHSEPALLISQKSLYSRIEEKISGLSSLEWIYLVDSEGDFPETLPFSSLLEPTGGETREIEIPEETIAAILYTSGTTGNPKGVELAHDQMMVHTVGHCRLVDYCSEDRTLVSLALSNNFAFSHQMLCALHAGATLEIVASFEPDEVLEKIETRGITMLYMMPVTYHALNGAAAERALPVPNRLRLAIVAGDTTPFVVMDNFKRIFGLDLCEGMGMTETQIYALNPLGAGKKRGSVGLAVDYTEVEIQDDRGNPSAKGEVGEIAVRGEIVMRNYLNDPGVTAKSFRNGWFLTGDLGCFDEEEYLWFRGRRKQLIVHDGSNISPQEVEEVFYHHPSIFEVGVIGIPDTFEGENLHAFAALKSGAKPVSEKELLKFAAEHLADYKLPESITFIDTLPKGATGKIDRKLLREWYLKEGTKNELFQPRPAESRDFG